MQLFVLDTPVPMRYPGPTGPENVTPVGRVLKATGQPASRFLFAEESSRRFPFRWSRERSWCGSLGLVSDEGTRDVAVNPKPAINPLEPARASGTISRTDRMPSERRQGWPSTSSTCCTLNPHPRFRETHGREIEFDKTRTTYASCRSWAP